MEDKMAKRRRVVSLRVPPTNGPTPDTHVLGRDLPHDGLPLQEIKAHSLEKYRRHNYLASMFANGMKKKWPQRAYIGLYAGAGRARVEGTGEIVETTALSVIRQPFTNYIFVDSDSECIDALERRVEALQTGHAPKFIRGDVNAQIGEIKNALPPYGPGNGLLSFCFVDPFSAKLSFKTIRSLAGYTVDFLILLALGHDVRRNFRTYYHDRSDTRIADLLDCPNWREEYEASGKNIVRFVLEKFGDNMVELGYQPPKPQHYHPVKVGGVLLYFIVFYSKHPVGQAFWDSTLVNVDPQLELQF